jgi:uncharacterized protein (UPF0276 family)
MHLAGHQHCGTHIVDTHDRAVLPYVWDLFALAWQKTGGVSTLLEWDGNIPSFDECHAEILKAKQYRHQQSKTIDFQEPEQDHTEAISTPLDFIVPQVMNNSQSEKSESQ